MRRLLFGLAMSTLTVSALAACGGGQTTGATPAGVGTPAVTPTPAVGPTITPTPAPGPTAYTATQHTGYIAIPYGNANPEHVAIYAPGATAPTTTITYAGCCISGAAFDPSANLLLATTDQGLVEFAPGGTPLRTISAQNGYAVAADPQGDSAIGGYAFGTSVSVYSGGSGSLRAIVAGAPGPNGLAFSPTGELAVPQSDGSVATYARGATTPNRSIPVNLLNGSGVNTAVVAYDAAGDLAIGGTAGTNVGVYAPGATTVSYTVPAAAAALVFTSSNSLVVATAGGVGVYVSGISTHTFAGASANALTADANGDFAWSGGSAASTYASSAFATTALTSATPSSAIAISP